MGSEVRVGRPVGVALAFGTVVAGESEGFGRKKQLTVARASASGTVGV